MTTKQERTPGPWRVEDGTIMAGSLEVAALCDDFDWFTPNHEANASHIVHCVNTYDEIVGALEDVIAEFGSFDPYMHTPASAAAMERARAALAKAKGGDA